MGRHDPSHHRFYFLRGESNDEIENSGSVCYMRFIRCCSRFFRGDTGSIFEHRKTLSAGDTAKRCSHLGGRWNGPAAATDTAALARGSVLVSVLGRGKVAVSFPSHARIGFARFMRVCVGARYSCK